jgi:ABC-2 type transport system permease protein
MHLFRMYWQRVVRKPGSVFLWMALPFVFMTIYTLAFGGDDAPPKVGIAIVDQDSSLASGLVKTALTQGPVAEMLTIIDARDLSDVETLFGRETASAALVIPPGFGDKFLRNEPDTLHLLRNPRHTIGPQIAEGVASTLVTIANELYAQFATPLRSVREIAERSESPTSDQVADISRQFFAAGQSARGLSVLQKIDVVVIDEEEKEEQGFSMAALFFPGLVMFGLLSLSLHIEHRFMMDRVHRVTHRLVTAPIAPWRIAVEQRVFAVSFLYLIGVVSLLVGAVIWHIPLRGFATANLVVVALALFIAGWNGSLFSLSRSPRAASAISSIAMVFLSILGGGFFPAEFMPTGFQSLIKWIPTGMANLALTRSLTGRELTISLPLLFAVSLAFFTVGIALGRKRIR